MKELVGLCTKCNKKIHCSNGFLNGIIQKNGKLICFSCKRLFSLKEQ